MKPKNKQTKGTGSADLLRRVLPDAASGNFADGGSDAVAVTSSTTATKIDKKNPQIFFLNQGEPTVWRRPDPFKTR